MMTVTAEVAAKIVIELLKKLRIHDVKAVSFPLRAHVEWHAFDQERVFQVMAAETKIVEEEQ